MKDRLINQRAYDDFEKLENFSGNDLNKYRNNKLASATGHTNFIKKLFPGRQRMSVLELGSGNSRSLFALEKAGMLEKGYGIEISRSRFEFAELWKKEWDFSKVFNINSNVIGADIRKFGPFDLCFCVDLAFQFFEPYGIDRVFEILDAVNKNLRDGGKVVIELDGCGRALDSVRYGMGRIWEEFSHPDPWRYSLWDCRYDKKTKLLTLKKIFIKRNMHRFWTNVTILRIYNKDEISALLKKVGFKKIKLYSGWEGGPFKNDASEFIVVGSK